MTLPFENAETWLSTFQGMSLLHAGKTSSASAICETSPNVEDAFVHCSPSLHAGHSVDRQINENFIGLPILPYHDGACSYKTSQFLHRK